MLSYLVKLHEQSTSTDQAFLSKREIVAFLMPSTDHSQATIDKNIISILENRASGYGYEREAETPGFEEAGDHLFGRGRLFMVKLDFMDFGHDRIRLVSPTNLAKARAYLSYATPPIIFERNTRDIRNAFFLEAYCDLEVSPKAIHRDVESQRIHREERPSQPAPAHSPLSLAGTFTPRAGLSRTFQGAFRRDLLRLYKRRCALCGIDVPSFLAASHIIPVGIDRSIANDRRNGLLLCALHDAAFEDGYFGLSDDFRIVLNPAFVPFMTHPVLQTMIIEMEGKQISPPSNMESRPLVQYVRRHRRLHGFPEAKRAVQATL